MTIDPDIQALASANEAIILTKADYLEMVEALREMIEFGYEWYDHNNGASEELTRSRAALAKVAAS